MSRWAVFVDAGWLFAAGATSAFGEPKERKNIRWDPERLPTVVAEHAATLVPDTAELLRIYWYDGSPNRLPVGEQHIVAGLTDVKLRLGRTARGGQKGVDGLIIHDLITHAYRRTIDDAVVVSGDEDLLDAIESAQANGTRVHLLEIPIGGIAEALLRAVDRRGQLDEGFWQEQFHLAAPPEPSTPDQPASSSGPANRPAWLDEPLPNAASNGSPDTSGRERSIGDLVDCGATFAEGWAASASSDEYAELLAARPYLRQDIDSQLLRAASAGGAWLDQIQRRTLRDAFWTSLAEAKPGPQ